MRPPGASVARSPTHVFQRMLDSIPFLLLLGVGFPTLLYTVWSIVELQHLPSFDQAPHGALHGTALEGAATTAPPQPPAAAEGAVTVSMRSMAFEPRTLEVPVGTTVTWVNDDLIDHAVAYGTPDTPAGERLFEDSGDFPRGESFSVTFETPGTHPIYCSTVGHYAAGMVMTVIVTEGAP